MTCLPLDSYTVNFRYWVDGEMRQVQADTPVFGIALAKVQAGKRPAEALAEAEDQVVVSRDALTAQEVPGVCRDRLDSAGENLHVFSGHLESLPTATAGRQSQDLGTRALGNRARLGRPGPRAGPAGCAD